MSTAGLKKAAQGLSPPFLRNELASAVNRFQHNLFHHNYFGRDNRNTNLIASPVFTRNMPPRQIERRFKASSGACAGSWIGTA